MNLMVLLLLVIFIIFGICELITVLARPKEILELNKELSEKIAQKRKRIDWNQGSFDRVCRIESNKIDPYLKEKEILETEMKNKVDKWFEETVETPIKEPIIKV